MDNLIQGIRNRLVPDWKNALKWYSVNSMLLSAALLASWASIPDDLKRLLPSRFGIWLVVAILLLGAGGRLWSQEKASSNEPH